MTTVEDTPGPIGRALGDTFKPVERECDELLAVSGKLPSGLTGTLYRLGPARWARDHAVHAFDGDGMMALLAFNGGLLCYRNRYVRTTNCVRRAGTR